MGTNPYRVGKGDYGGSKYNNKEWGIQKCNGARFEIVSPKYLLVNGWECQVQNNGVIKCTAKELCIDGIHSMRYTLYKNGFAKLTLKTPNEPLRVIKMGFVVKKGEIFGNGTLGLSDGFIDH